MYDYIVVGGGIIGTATAWLLQQRYPDKETLLLEKESNLAEHQTGRNSGVIHAGVYYEPGSLKVRFCKEGNRLTFQFCKEHHIPCERCGKILVATDQKEYVRMQRLFEHIQENRIHAEPLNNAQLKEREPNISGLGGLFIRDTGIVDFRQITGKMAELFKGLGGKLKLNARVHHIQETDRAVDLTTSLGHLQARYVIICGGLMSDLMAKMLGLQTDFQVIPFRGEYFKLPRSKRDIITHLIYPIPDPSLPFLGIHLTRMIDGSITVGPNAVLSLKREGYRKSDIDLSDIKEMIAFRGFRRILRNHAATGMREFKNSFFKRGYLKQVQKYCPGIRLPDLKPYLSGVRAQAVDADGTLIRDFLFIHTKRTFHVCNAPSPAATSAIPIGRHIVDKVAQLYGIT